MKNIAAILIPSQTFASRQITFEKESRTIYDGLNEFVRQLSDRLMHRLQSMGVDCDRSVESFKPEGHSFHAGPLDSRFIITVSPEREVLPKAAFLFGAEAPVGFWGIVWPRGNRIQTRNWIWFEPICRSAIETEFPDCHPKWMSAEELILTDPKSLYHEEF